MKRPLWKKDWFWFVLLPEILVGLVFALAILAWIF